MNFSLFLAYANEYPTRAAAIRMMRYRSPYLIPIQISYRDFPSRLEMPMLKMRSIQSEMSGYFRVGKNFLQSFRWVTMTARTKTIRMPSLAIENISWYCHPKTP